MDYRFEIIERALLHEGFVRVDGLRLRHSLYAGGWSPPLRRELAVRGHAVAVLLYDPRLDQVVMIEQFRTGAIQQPGGPWLLELAAGFIEEGESPEEVAHREVGEETGCRILALEPIATYLVSPGWSSETMHLFCGKVDASHAGGVHGLKEEGEDIQVRVLDAAEALARLDAGMVNSATPLVALQWLARNRERLQAEW